MANETINDIIAELKDVESRLAGLFTDRYPSIVVGTTFGDFEVTAGSVSHSVKITPIDNDGNTDRDRKVKFAKGEYTLYSLNLEGYFGPHLDNGVMVHSRDVALTEPQRSALRKSLGAELELQLMDKVKPHLERLHKETDNMCKIIEAKGNVWRAYQKLKEIS